MIGNGAASMRDMALAGCPDLTSVYFGGNDSSLGLYVLDRDGDAPLTFRPVTTSCGLRRLASSQHHLG
jgi:hypothetical protein